MAREQADEPCPFCSEYVPVTARRCRFCGEPLDEADEDRRRPARRARTGQTIEPTDFIVPTNVSGWSIVACYAGLVGFCVPFAGLLFAIPAFICGIIALRKRKRGSSYGAVTSDIRAVIGLILSSLAILGWGGLLIFLLLAH